MLLQAPAPGELTWKGEREADPFVLKAEEEGASPFA